MKKSEKDLRYNEDHPRPQFGEDFGVGDFPRTVDAEVPPLVEVEDMPIQVKGTKYYRMGGCTVTYKVVPEGNDVFPGHHLSVSHPERYPTWDEVAEARYRLIPDHIYMVMPLPPMHDYLNIHPYMFNMHELKYYITTEVVRDVSGMSIGKQIKKISLRED